MSNEYISCNRQIASGNRNCAIDLAKGIALLCVIVAHIGIPIQNGSVIMYSFHLPIFFVSSGWFFSPVSNSNNSFWEYFRHKSKGLLKPYLVLASIIVLYNLVVYGYSVAGDSLWKFMIQRRYSTLWFLAALFCANIIFFFIVKLFKNKKRILIVSTVISVSFIIYDTIIGVPLLWNIDTALISQIFMASGYVFRSRIEKIAASKSGISVSIGMGSMLLCFALTILNQKLGFHSFEMYRCSYGCFPITLLAAVLGSFGLVIICHNIKLKIVSDLGKNSLVYFGLHQAVAQPISNKILAYANIDNLWMRFAFSFFIVMLICSVIDRLLIWCKVHQWMTKK